ncbi:MAG: ferrous iron transport protein B [Armatimonadota bacterium]
MSALTRCHQQPAIRPAPGTARPVLAIVGNPNVGKSVLFNCMTGARATVSNYPGTTVEVSRGRARLAGREIEVVDTPGMYSLLPISEEEAVARRLLLEESPRQVLHVVDAKNLQRMLPMTLQLLEAGLPVTLALNMLDESEELGFSFEIQALAAELGIPVIGTAGSTSRGVGDLSAILGRRLTDDACEMPPAPAMQYDDRIEAAIREIDSIIGAAFTISARALALLLLQADKEIGALVEERLGGEAAARIQDIVAGAQAHFAQPLGLAITLRRQAVVNEIVARVMRMPATPKPVRLEWISRLLMHPLWGLPVLAAVIYFGIYQFVGVFGGGVLVDLLESKLFGEWVNPWLTRFVEGLLPNPLWSNLIVGEYGIFTLGITYAVAIVLPIVGLFFFMFAILEDSGYLPRLAMLVDRLFKTIGLNGRAVIPLVLGFGCDTMATMVTRVLETKRERIIATLLLALAIPCAAQSGLFLAMIGAVQPYGLLIYLGIMACIFLVVGVLAAKLLPGRQAHFYLEMPPIRLPKLKNVLSKTYTRLEWYFLEILPMFILASLILWLGSLTWNGQAIVFMPHQGLLGYVERALDPLAALIGLPTTQDVLRNPALEFSGGTILLGGFFRRDFGAAGLWSLFRAGLLSPVQVLVTAVTLTLFLPCIAQFLVMKKERGLWTTLAMSAFILVVAFGVGYLLRIALQASGIDLILNTQAMPASY